VADLNTAAKRCFSKYEYTILNHFSPQQFNKFNYAYITGKKKAHSCFNWVFLYLSISSSRFVRNKRCLCVWYQNDKKFKLTRRKTQADCLRHSNI